MADDHFALAIVAVVGILTFGSLIALGMFLSSQHEVVLDTSPTLAGLKQAPFVPVG